MSMSFGSVIGRLLWSSGGVMFLWFFIFFEVLYYCLHIWSSSPPPPVLLITFRREIPSISLLGILSLSQTVYGYMCSTMIALSWILKLICLLSILQHPECWKPSFYFAKVSTKAQVCNLSLVCRFRLAFWTCSLTICQSSLLPQPLGAYTGHQLWSEGVWGGGERYAEHWGCPWANEGVLGEGPHQLVSRLLDVCEAVSRIHLSLMPSKNFICSSPRLFLPLVMQLMIQYSGWGKREMSLFSSIPTQLRKRGDHSHPLTIPCRRNHRPQSSLLALSCAALGEGCCR